MMILLVHGSPAGKLAGVFPVVGDTAGAGSALLTVQGGGAC